MSELFRREAVDHATRRLTGEVVLATPMSVKLLGGLFGCLLLLAGIFAATASYARKETVAGWIVPEGGLIRIAARQPGVVDSAQVSEGAWVRVGQPLITLRNSVDSEGGDVGAAMTRDLAAEAVANGSAAQASRAKLSAQALELRGRKSALLRELDEVRARQEVLARRRDLAEQQVKRGETLLASGYLAPSGLDTRRSNALVAAQDFSEVRTSVLTYEREIGDIDRQLAGLPAELAAINAEAAQAEATLSQRGNLLSEQNSQVVTAPVSGQVLTLPVERGQTVVPGTVVAVVTPTNSVLIAELFIPSRAAGFIRAGQEVRLMYQAFPYQRFGTGSGVVQSVSRTVLAPNEVNAPGLSVREPVFRVRVRLERTMVTAYGHDIPLQPGMLLNADVVIDRRTLFQWLLDPLYAAGRRA